MPAHFHLQILASLIPVMAMAHALGPFRLHVHVIMGGQESTVIHQVCNGI